MRTCSHGYGQAHRWMEYDPITMQDVVRVCREAEAFRWLRETEEADPWWMQHNGYPVDIPDEGVVTSTNTIHNSFRRYEYQVRVKDRSLPKPPITKPKSRWDIDNLPTPIDWDGMAEMRDDQRMFRDRVRQMSKEQADSYLRDMAEATSRVASAMALREIRDALKPMGQAMGDVAKEGEKTFRTMADLMKVPVIDYARDQARAQAQRQVDDAMKAMNERRVRDLEARMQGLPPQWLDRRR